MSKSKIFFWSLVSFLVGVAFASFISVPTLLLGLFFIAGATVTTFGAMDYRDRTQILLAGVFFVIATLGMLRFNLSTAVSSAPLLRLGSGATIQGAVDEEPVLSDKSQRLVVRDDASQARVLVVAHRYPEYRYGDVLVVAGALERPKNFSDDFDYRAYLAKERIFYSMSLPAISVTGANGGSWLRRRLFAMKASFSDNLNRALPEPHAAFMSGLILGERRSLPQSLTDELKITGTTHLVAISGYNITIVASALLTVLTFLWIPFGIAFSIAIAGIVLFTILTGATASVVRAAVMGTLVLVAKGQGRQYRIKNALTFAAGAMVFYNPAILRFDTGFQLSFLATLGLVYGVPMLDRAFEKFVGRIKIYARQWHIMHAHRDLPRVGKNTMLREVFLSTVAAQLFVLPLLIFQFGQLSLVSPIANLAVLPFVPATMFLGFFTGMLGYLSDMLMRIAGVISWLFLHYELGAIHALSQVPFASLSVRGGGVVIVFGLYGAFGILLWRRRIRRIRAKSHVEI